MSLSSANLRDALDCLQLRSNFKTRLKKEIVLEKHKLPVPFCWGPNGSLILLGLLMLPVLIAFVLL